MISPKVGAYVIGGTANALRRADAKPTFVVMTDCSAAYYSQMRALMGPDVLIEMRWTEPNDYQPVDDPERRADEWWARRQSAVMSVPETDYTVIAGYNEKPKSEAALFCRFELRRIGHLHNSGHHAAVLSAGVGCPDLDEWVTYAPLRMAMRKGDAWDLHEYASSYADIDNRYHVGRFTLPVVAANLGDWPVVISEVGYDVVEGQGQAGWQLTTNDEGCLAMLRKFGTFYDGQPRVIGCGAFQQGGVDPRWRPFNMFGVWPAVVGEYAASPVAAPVVPTLTLVPPIRNYVRVSQEWGPTANPPHFGIDFSCVEGTPIYAAMDGIAYRFTDAAENGGFGRYVRIEGQGYKVYTAHLSEWAVVNGQRVKAGGKIGLSGNTGNSTGPHMHFEVRRVAGSPYRYGAIDPTGLIEWPEPVPASEPLPNDEQGPPEVLATKVRYWLEEEQRQREAGNVARADAIHASNILLGYRLEAALR